MAADLYIIRYRKKGAPAGHHWNFVRNGGPVKDKRQASRFSSGEALRKVRELRELHSSFDFQKEKA